MKQEATSFFKDFCSTENILAQKSDLEGHLHYLEEVDFWMLLSKKKEEMSIPIVCMEVGNSFVLHFCVSLRKHDVLVQVRPFDRKAFVGLLEDYTKNADK